MEEGVSSIRYRRNVAMTTHSTRLALGLIIVGASWSCQGLVVAVGQSGGGNGAPVVHVAEVDALIHPASAEFITQAITGADADGAELLVLVLRTPGGLVDSTRDINTIIIEAETPVAVYGGPSGARAASAGFLITT